VHRAVRHKAVEQGALLEVFDEEGNCPSGVTVALLSHSTWMRAKVSATTGPANTRSTTGCSPIGSAGNSPLFLPIPHDSNDLPNRRIRQLTDLGSKFETPYGL
jgi:hypothetical protein